jgi:hypothetical protein
MKVSVTLNWILVIFSETVTLVQNVFRRQPNIIDIQEISGMRLVNCVMVFVLNSELEFKLIYERLFSMINFFLITGLLLVNCFGIIVWDLGQVFWKMSVRKYFIVSLMLRGWKATRLEGWYKQASNGQWNIINDKIVNQMICHRIQIVSW